MVQSLARYNPGTDWDMMSATMALEIGMEIRPLPECIGWNCPTMNKKGGRIEAMGIGTSNIMQHGTDWSTVKWAVCNGMDMPLLLKRETWNFLMNIHGPPWYDYCMHSEVHLSFLDIGQNGEAPPECCKKCKEERDKNKELRRLREEKENPGKPAEPLKIFRKVLLAQGKEMAKKNKGKIVTLEADLPGGWKAKD